MSTSPVRHLFTEELYSIPPSISVILHRPWEKYSPDETMLLAKILGSVKLDLAMVKITCTPSVSAEDLKKLGSARVIIFGSQAEYSAYEPVQAQGFTVIRADDLSSLDDAKKKSLWVALRQMFGI